MTLTDIYDMKPVDKSIYNFLNSQVGRKTGSIYNSYIDDPTVMGFNLVIDINDAYSPLFCEDQNPNNSAINYLKSIDEYPRAIMLKEFKYRLRDLVTKFPFYFQSITGLDSFYKYNPKETWRTKERVVVIKTLESLDLRVGNMIDKYMKAFFDEDYMREMLPLNLKKFNMTVIFSEIRNFKTFFDTINSTTQAPEKKILVLNDLLSCYIIKLAGCQFDFSESNPWMSEVSNGQCEKPIENEFRVICDRIIESHKMNFFDFYTSGINDAARDKVLNMPNAYLYDNRRILWGTPTSEDFSEYGNTLPTIDEAVITKEEEIFNDTKKKKGAIGKVLDEAWNIMKKESEIYTDKIKREVSWDNVKNTVIATAVNEVKQVAGGLVLGNTDDIRNRLLNEGWAQYLARIAVEKAKKSLSGDEKAAPEFPVLSDINGRTENPADMGGQISSSATQNISGLGDTTPDGRSVYVPSIGGIAQDQITNSPYDIGAYGPDNRTRNLASLDGMIDSPHTFGVSTLDSVPSIYTLTPSQVANLGSGELVRQSMDVFKTLLGTIPGFDMAPFSNLLNNLVGGIIPDLIRNGK
jgi:hypothetical protein